MVDGSVVWNKKSLIPDYWIPSESSNPELLLKWRPAPLRTSGGEPQPQWTIASDSSLHNTWKLSSAARRMMPMTRWQFARLCFAPGIHFVSVKTTEQQNIKALRNTRLSRERGWPTCAVPCPLNRFSGRHTVWIWRLQINFRSRST